MQVLNGLFRKCQCCFAGLGIVQEYIVIRLGRKRVNFVNSLTLCGVCYMGSKDEDAVKYF